MISNGNMINGKECLMASDGLFLRYYPTFAQELRQAGKTSVRFTSHQDRIYANRSVYKNCTAMFCSKIRRGELAERISFTQK
jgi:hypothetical protein